jgi:bifunctional non-homologous end joining protein LigD
VPSGSRWVHEIKLDGYRVQVHPANEAAKIVTRHGHDWTHRFKKVSRDAWHIKAASAVLDGEIVVPAAGGTTDFSVLQNELKGQSSKIVMVAFDLLYPNGRDLRKVPLCSARPSSRRSSPAPTSSSAKLRDRRPGDIRARLQSRPEGVVSKVRDSVYPTGRCND